MRRSAILLPLVLVAPATAQGLDGNYACEMRCEIVAAATSVPLVVKIRLTVAGKAVRYERDVLNPNSSQPSGVKETGSGTVAPPSISMTGRATGASYSYEATYQGTINAGVIGMTGTQKWYINKGDQNRACKIMAKRQ